jgi:hypothetical protein
MKRSSVLLVAASLCALGLTAAGPAGAAALPKTPVQDSDPFNSPNVHELGSGITCGLHFDCNTTPQDQVLQMANQCTSTKYHFPVGLMTEFRTFGDFDNCAMPTSFQPASPIMSGKAQWPVCCVVDNGAQGCDLECHYQFIPNG